MNDEIKDRFQRLFERARDESFSGRTGHTVELLEEMLRLAEDNEELRQSEIYQLAHRNLGLGYHDMNQHADAASHLRRALELGTEEDGPLYRMFGRSLWLTDEYEDAINALRKAVELDEGDDEARYYLGWAYVEVGRRTKDRAKQIQYRRLAQEQCDVVKEVAPPFGKMLQWQIDNF
jgi:tetratricopeptide (TPR) repeat protein